MNPIGADNNSEPDAVLMSIKEWIQDQTGIRFGPEKIPVLQSRLESMCLRYGYKDLHAIQNVISEGKDNTILLKIIESATTNHTHFYREVEPLEFFQETILNSLKREESWRIWSAASSSGEELYTLAMLTVEKYGYAFTKNNVSFLGTDVNQKVIEQAEKGIYNNQRVADLPDTLKEKWLEKVALGNFSIAQELKDLCTFRSLNLKRYPWPFTRTFHVIFLRNVLYYFDEKTQSEIVNNAYEVSQPGGWLVTSVTENLGTFKHNWKKVRAGVFQK